ncbi:hypothetical protein NCS57_00409200 [Fusarium keratoplasticum]|uniref:Uncharacterized protein n=1 Tax=Fusarium keratoplasticum TaxID=1328300 RepID=A0ACC0R6L1_9HYPO|nr:hypothetical protein NCS57_00409200 [Fusarium keratoplasticum]KAI8675095.1 hypothetical protein NCS57_00409200 [Fusarium keratoplasticum]KAI8681551.1 hypothetical protein NCS55_00406900 [Fusarium keratoplasticum]
MCHKTTVFFTVCAHSRKVPTVKCDKALWWKPKLSKDQCIITRMAELARGWCAECEAVFKANGINSSVVKDFDPRSADFISRYWAYKSQAGWVGPMDATLFPKDLVERKDEIVCNTLNDTRYEIYALRREIEVYGADRICIEKLFNCVAPGPSDFPTIIEKARRLTLEWGTFGGMDEPLFPRISSLPTSKAKAPEMAKQDPKGEAPERVAQGEVRNWE